MHVGEETFHSIRMNAVEYERVVADINLLLDEYELDETTMATEYPTLHRFFGALGAITSESDNTPVLADTPLVDDDDDEEAELEATDQSDKQEGT